MQSPKFPLKVKDLRHVVEAARLKVIWKSKVRESMRRQPIPDPVENLDFHMRLSNACDTIHAQVCSGSYTPDVPARFLVEKSKGLCRQLVIPSARDALLLQALSDDLWAVLKSQAPTDNAYYAPNDHKFSRTVRGHEAEYDSLAAWLAFQEAIFGFTESQQFVVVTDIANYYDFIGYDHLRNILADKAKAKEHALDLLIYLLSSMLWQPDYMPRIPVGLPQIALDAPRLLAHCFLFDIDALMVHGKRLEYVRYMDDIDIGTPTLSEAKEAVRDLDLALQTRQIRLNAGKTKILTAAEAAEHFKVIHNASLDDLAEMIEVKTTLHLNVTYEQQIIRKRIQEWRKNKTFESGNGSKILKRLINMARAVKLVITPEWLKYILTEFPGLRENALVWWSEGKNAHRTLEHLVALGEKHASVDDAFKMNLVKSIVAARLPASTRTLDLIERLLRCMDLENAWDFYASLWLSSKYMPEQRIWRLIEQNVATWSTSSTLTRLVAGMYPHFRGSQTYITKLNALINRTGQLNGFGVLDLHNSLCSGNVGYNALEGFLTASNKSLPNKLSHAKFLLLLSALSNTELRDVHRRRLMNIHSHAFSDPFYRRHLRSARII